MSVGEICKRIVETAGLNDPVAVAAEKMRQRTVRSLVIVNDAREPIGIVTDRDLIGQVLAKGRNTADTLLRDVMTPNPQTISEDASIETALARMREGRFRRLPVVGTDKKLVGLISVSDIMIQLGNEFTQINLVFEREGPHNVITA
jgi:CBS domain-containing protein